MRVLLMLLVVFSFLLSGCELNQKESNLSPRNPTRASKTELHPQRLANESNQLELAENPQTSQIENIPHYVDTPAKKEWIYLKGSPNSKQVAITFDDGPDYYYTVKILDILKQEKVPATFFVMGKNAKKYPAVLKRIHSEGHVIGNHSWNHADFSKLPLEELKEEIDRTDRFLKEQLNINPTLFRPPYGSMNDQFKQYIMNSPYTVIHWSIDTKDWTEKPANQIMDMVRKELSAGDILLFHSAGGGQSLQGTIDVLPQVIRYIRQQGFEPVTVDQLLQIPADQHSSLQ